MQAALQPIKLHCIEPPESVNEQTGKGSWGAPQYTCTQRGYMQARHALVSFILRASDQSACYESVHDITSRGLVQCQALGECIDAHVSRTRDFRQCPQLRA